MAEFLYIRLASRVDEQIPWLITNHDQTEIIASGELASADKLNELHAKSLQRKVVAFVPASDVVIKALNVPSKSQRAMRLAAPYMLEEDLAQDVEELFFAYSSLKSATDDNCLIAAVERKQLSQWQSWLRDADILCDKIIPDALALPDDENAWSTLEIAGQLLLKKGQWQAASLDEGTWQYLLKTRLEQDETLLEIKALSPLSISHDNVNVIEDLTQLPLFALAQHADVPNINLLQGEYQVKQKRSTAFTHWRLAASLVALAFIVNLVGKGIEYNQLTNAQSAIEKEIVATYKTTFPQAKRVSAGTVRSLLKRKLSELGSGDQQETFLAMVAKIQPAFASVSDLKPETVKFDGKRKEIRIQAVASNYQAFESFKAELEKVNLTVSQGSQNNQGDQVVGSFSIKEGA